jgi:hypothetical protein
LQALEAAVQRWGLAEHLNRPSGLIVSGRAARLGLGALVSAGKRSRLGDDPIPLELAIHAAWECLVDDRQRDVPGWSGAAWQTGMTNPSSNGVAVVCNRGSGSKSYLQSCAPHNPIQPTTGVLFALTRPEVPPFPKEVCLHRTNWRFCRLLWVTTAQPVNAGHRARQLAQAAGGTNRD